MSVIDELAIPDFTEHCGPPDHRNGVAGAEAMARSIRAGFPDSHMEIEDAISEGDRVVLRLRVGGMYLGLLFNVPPMGKRAQWSEIRIMRVKNGKMVEHWFVADTMSMMQQLGPKTRCYPIRSEARTKEDIGLPSGQFHAPK